MNNWRNIHCSRKSWITDSQYSQVRSRVVTQVNCSLQQAAMNKLMTSSSSSAASELLPPFVRLAGEDRLAGVMHHRDKKKCDIVTDFGGAGGVTSSLYALTHDVIGFGGCGSSTSSMALSTAVAAAGGVSSSVAPPRGLGLSDSTGLGPMSDASCTNKVHMRVRMRTLK